ncbi:ATP-binding cassette domain-containing protein [Arthrobacter sp. Y-9]|uniref:ATP-binding cassette domain-containing protein n=1 Tax=Arthrobacter sp. Y-9 TaxID=3039385 RepID=UPI00241F7ED3|nr:ATP-binding cassette domain-containing protein [Arthrobacter sp. Y-9]WFR84930.1 ATP-binding cassette domain-containing protein [Arthrobacter sp. Y-9]
MHTVTLQHLALDGISQRYAGRRVLSDITFAVSPGQRVGLIGENGSGKSTVLRIAAGAQRPDAGLVLRPERLGYFAQELDAPPGSTAGEVLDRAQRPALDALAALESQDVDAYAQALDDAERLGAWSAQARRGEVLAGLGLSGLDERTPVERLSGGQRSRLALAALLLEEPDALLLDEPSNHLDDAAVAYLESALRDWKGPVLFASHDRTFLDRVATRIVDLDPLPVPAVVLADAASPGASAPEGAADAAGAEPGDTTSDSGSGLGVRHFGGDYSSALRARRDLMRQWRDRYAAEQAELLALREEIEVGARNVNRKSDPRTEARASRKFYADKDARVIARRARNARVRLETLESGRVRRPPEPLRFAGFDPAFTALGDVTAEAASTTAARPASSGADLVPGRHGDHDAGPQGPAAESVLRAHRVAVPGRLEPVSFGLAPQGRLLLTGANGSGKSTLLKVLAGGVSHEGEILRSDGATVGYLAQDTVFDDPGLSAAAWYARAVGYERAESTPLASLGLLPERDTGRALGELSIGQQRRVALAALVADPPRVLLLDEPSNHLSLALVEELEEALESFAGAVVIATHDRWLRTRWRERNVPEISLG